MRLRLDRLGQKGFTGVEAVLVVVVLAIIGGTGYYVYHANRKAGDTLDSASKISQQSSAKVTKKSADGGKGGGDSHSQTGPAKDEVFIINEWNVSAEIPKPPESAALIQYKISSYKTDAYAAFTTQELIDAGGSGCAASTGPAGTITRATPDSPFYFEGGASSGTTVSKELATGNIKVYKKVGNYYYWYTHAQGACGSDPSKTGPLQATASAQVQAIVSHLTTE